ncbi:MAG: IS1 family transposase [Magnetococcales bacterium]|nr:IS1 family transposase [Magnetococcales bacterium]
MAVLDVKCHRCAGLNVVKHGKLPGRKQRYRCGSPDCGMMTFILNYTAIGRTQEAKTKIVDMAMNGSGIRDTARVLKVSPTTVIAEI